jgi:hypothetical protein
MLLAELILRKKYLEEKIEELGYFLEKIVRDAAISQKELNVLRAELDDYLEQLQSYVLKIESANSQLELSIDNSKIPIKNAIVLRDTLMKKIEFITGIIDNGNSNLDISSFFQQRDRLYEEYFVINRAITTIDWSANID